MAGDVDSVDSIAPPWRAKEVQVAPRHPNPRTKTGSQNFILTLPRGAF